MTLIRPSLEYASSLWNPYTDTDIKRLEQIRKNVARFVCKGYNIATSTSTLVKSLGWDTLEHRRLFNQSVLFYKFHKHLVNCQTPSLPRRRFEGSLFFIPPHKRLLNRK